VAVVGASETPGKYGYILLKTLLEEGYPGQVFAVSARGGSLEGRPFLRSLAEVGAPVDVALIVRPAPECPALVAEVAARGIPFAIVYAAGFAEQGPDGARLEAEMRRAAAGRTRLVGPNGMNIFSAPARLNLSAIVPFPVGKLALLSASGNLGYALAQEAAQRGGPGFSRFVSVGNQADLALDEYLDFLRADAATRAVLVYLEGLVAGRARAFLDALALTAASKPVLVLRGGRTRAGRQAARSHTGALAGEAELLRAALEQAGAVLLDRVDEALATAQAFLESPLPRGPRAVLVGEGGGHATLLCDAVSEAGLRLDPLPPPVVSTIRPQLPPFAAIVDNPVEMCGATEYALELYQRVLAPILDAGAADLVLLFGGYALYDEAAAAFLDEARRAHGVPVLLHDLYADAPRPALQRLRARGLPVFASSDVAARVAGALNRGRLARERCARWGAGAAPRPPPQAWGGLVAAARRRGSPALTEDEASRLLDAFRIPVLPARLARGAEEAVAAARQLGPPVALKVHAAEIVHKSDVGGVHLELRTEDDVRQAFEAAALAARTAGAAPEVRLTPMRRGGIEALVGARRDPQLGPFLAFGAGGLHAESRRDVALRLLPCEGEERRAMLEETSLGRALAASRGGAVDPAALDAVLAGVAQLLAACPEVSDVEINPLRCAPDGVVALDARVLLSAP
jgi:acetyltransferase